MTFLIVILHRAPFQTQCKPSASKPSAELGKPVPVEINIDVRFKVF